MQRVVTQSRCSVLLVLIFLCSIVVNNAIGDDTDLTNGLRVWTGYGSESLKRHVRASPDAWIPPDIDSVQPPVANATSCSVRDVVSNVGTSVETFFHNLNRVTATETIKHQTVSRSGTLRYPEIYKNNYVALLESMPNGGLSLQEYRERYRPELSVSSNDINTAGVFGFAAIFHPNYVQDYRMTCEGLGTWQGQPAWQVRFEELPGNTHHMSSLTVKQKTYDLRVRGRAWILADSYQLARIETDLVEGIPEIRLRFQHEVIEYSLVRLSSTDAVMLPLSSEIYMDFQGHRFYRRHSYANFKLFSVKVNEKFASQMTR